MKRVIAILLFASACGAPETHPSSQIQWGVLRGAAATFRSARTLLICGDGALRPVGNDALWEWNNARGRHHSMVNSPSCAPRYRFDASLRVVSQPCSAGVAGFHTQSGNHHDITICAGVPRANWIRVMLHEVGHAFGLCDQYSPGNSSQIAFHSNCGWPRSNRPARSVMGGLYSGSPEALTPDDVLGIKYLQAEDGR